MELSFQVLSSERLKLSPRESGRSAFHSTFMISSSLFVSFILSSVSKFHIRSINISSIYHERFENNSFFKSFVWSAIDYENFITNMLADRQFIEDSADLCEKGEVWRCLLVQKRGCQDGVLVLPEEGCFVGYAAYLASANQ